MDQLFCIWQGECGTEFSNVPEVVEGGSAQVVDVGVKSQMSVKSHTQVGNCCGEGHVNNNNGGSQGCVRAPDATNHATDVSATSTAPRPQPSATRIISYNNNIIIIIIGLLRCF